MKSLSAGLQAHYEQETTTLACLWNITRRDDQVFAFTDHDRAITYGSITYEPTSAFDASAIATRSELNVDDVQALGLLDSAGITAEDIEAGLWDGATVELLEVNYLDLTMGDNVLRVGELGEVQRKRGQYVAEMRGLMQKLQNNIGRIVTPTCDVVEFGDARCGVDREALRVTGTVTSVTSQRAFAGSALAQAADYFTRGVVTFSSGLNDGISMEVKLHATGGAFTLQLPLPYAITVGDTFSVVPGCDKSKAACIAYDNVLNFRGFSFVPGQDQVMLVGGQ